MAELYLAKDTRSSRMVVLKRILPYLAEEVEFLKMFLDEARIAAQLHHPNIVEVFELGRLDGSTFISMEWVDGIDLRKVLLKEQERGAPIPPGVGAWLIARLCEGLHHAHERPGPDGKPLGIIHRDVSPQNVMVSYRGEVKLVDFGIAKATAWMSRSKPGVIKGKFLYLAPEQLTQERLDHRADLFALGTLLYELTVGKSPFYRTTTEAVIFSIRMENPAPPESVLAGYPQTLSRIVMRCLEKDREQRYQTADEIRRALDAFIADEAPTTQGDVAAYMAGLFGDDDERTSVYLPPNAQSGVKPAPRKPGPPVPDEDDDDEDRTMSIPGALSPERRAEKPPPPVPLPREDGPSTEPVRPRSPRDVQATAPIEPPTISMASMRPGDEGEETAVGRSAPTLAQVEPPNTGPTLEQRTGRPIENAASDPSISTVSQPAPRLLVPPRRPLSSPPVAEAPAPRTDETRSELVSVEAPKPVERPRPRRPARKEPFDVEDHIATVDMARFEDSVVVQRNRRLAVGLMVAIAVAVLALLAWAFLPAPKPTPRPKPVVEKTAPALPPRAPPARATIRVTFRGTPGLKLTVGEAVVVVGESLELPPGPIAVRYTCPGRKKQRPRTVEFTPVVPDTADDVAVDVPACL